MRFIQINEHSVGVFSQRPTNKFCGYFAELVDCNVHPKNEFDFVEFFNCNTSKLFLHEVFYSVLIGLDFFFLNVNFFF